MSTVKATGQISLLDMNDVLASSTAPSNPTDGALWWNTNDNQLYVYHSGVWVLSTDGMEIGGRNILQNTDFSNGLTHWASSGNQVGSVDTTDTYLGKNSLKIVASGAGGSGNNINQLPTISIISGQIYSLSFYAKSVSGSTSLHSEVWGGVGGKNFAITTSWAKYTVQFTGSTQSGFYFWLNASGTALITMPMLEVGNINSDWTPAPEDTQTQIDTINTTLGNMANDGVLDFSDRQTVKDKLTGIIGYVQPDTTTTLPTSVTLDASGKGSFYKARRTALDAGIIPTDSNYINLATQYTNLKTYLEGLTPIDCWDVSATHSSSTITIDPTTWRNNWMNYYLAEQALDNETSTKLNNTVNNNQNNSGNNNSTYNADFATFARSSTAYDENGVSYAVDTPRFKTTGVNLLPPLNEWTVSANATLTINSDYDGSLVATTDFAGIQYPFGTTLNGKQVTLSIGNLNASVGQLRYYLIIQPASGSTTYAVTETSSAGVDTGLLKATVTIPVDAQSVTMAIDPYQGSNATQSFKNFQLELGSTNTAFTPIDRSILIEEPITNIIPQADLSALYGYTGDGTNTASTQNSDGSWRVPLKNSLGTKVAEITTTKSYPVTSGKDYVESFYFKTDSTDLTFTFTFFTTGHHIVSATIVDYGNGWKRAFAKYTIESGATTIRALDFNSLSFSTGTYIDIKDAQLEQGSFVTTFTDSSRSGDILNLPFIDFTNSFTVEARIIIDSKANGDQTILYQREATANNKTLHLVIRGGKPYFGFYGDDCGTSTSVVNNNIQHDIAFVYDKTTKLQSIYVDGVLSTTRTAKYGFLGTTGNTYIGSYDNGTAFLNGYMSDLRISNIARTDTDIYYTHQNGYTLDSFTEYKMSFDGGDVYYEQMIPSSQAIASLDNRLTTAEQKITDDSIISTVTSSDQYSQDMNSKANSSELSNYATTGYADNAGSTAEANANNYTDQQVGAIDLTPFIQKTSTIQTADDITTNISKSGGINIIKNSVGFASLNFWTLEDGSITTQQSDELDNLGFGSGFHSALTGGHLSQTFNTIVGTTYTLSFYLRKEVDDTTSGATDGFAGMDLYDGSTKLSFNGLDTGQGITIGDGAISDNTIVYGYKPYTVTWTATQPTAKITVAIGAGATATLTGIMVSVGDIALSWQLSAGEIYNTSVKMDLNGIKVSHFDNGVETGFTVMTPDKFAGYYDVNQDGIIDESDGSVDEVFRMDAENFIMKNAVVKDSILMDTVKIIPINASGHIGWAWVASSD